MYAAIHTYIIGHTNREADELAVKILSKSYYLSFYSLAKNYSVPDVLASQKLRDLLPDFH